MRAGVIAMFWIGTGGLRICWGLAPSFGACRGIYFTTGIGLVGSSIFAIFGGRPRFGKSCCIFGSGGIFLFKMAISGCTSGFMGAFLSCIIRKCRNKLLLSLKDLLQILQTLLSLSFKIAFDSLVGPAEIKKKRGYRANWEFSKGGFFSERADVFVISPNRRT